MLINSITKQRFIKKLERNTYQGMYVQWSIRFVSASGNLQLRLKSIAVKENGCLLDKPISIFDVVRLCWWHRVLQPELTTLSMMSLNGST